MPIAVVIPSRGRPQRAREAVLAARDSAIRADTSVVLVVDEDDPLLPEYRVMVDRLPPPRVGAEHRPLLVVLSGDETGCLVTATNTVSMRIARDDPATIIGNLGDDHLVRTFGWDRLITDALSTPGMAYGDDLIHGEHLPSAPFFSAVIPLALGWYMWPGCRHLYVDNIWRDVAEQAGVRRYLPELTIEHMHPAVGKAVWDEGYHRANDQPPTRRDHKAYEYWRARHMARDVRRVREALA